MASKLRVIYWERSVGPGGRDLVPMYFKSRLTRDTDEGSEGDVKARPVKLGPGPYTGVFGGDTFVDEAGEPIDFSTAHGHHGGFTGHKPAMPPGTHRG